MLIPIDAIQTVDTVDSLNHPLAHYLLNFLERKKRLESREIIIDDIENIEEALRAGVSINKLFISGTQTVIPQQFLDKLNKSLPIYAISPRTAKKIFETEKMTRIFAIAEVPNHSLDKDYFLNLDSDLMILDGINISGNIGAIIRTSVALNAGGIVVLNTHPMDLYDRRIIRASRGYIFRIPIVTCSSAELINFCQTKHFKLVVMSATATQTVDEIVNLNEKLAIILGGEKSGCSPELYDRAHLAVKIPIHPAVESLNVSVAAAIILYLRQQFSLKL